MPVVNPSTALIDLLRFGAYLVQAQVTAYQYGPGGGVTTFNVPVSTAKITADRNSATRRQGQMTVEVIPSIPPPPLLPTSPSSPLAPFGTEVFIQTALVNPATGPVTANSQGPPTPWVPLGLFEVATATVADTVTDLVLTLELYDRSWLISQRAFVQPYNVPATTSGTFVAEIEALLNMVWSLNPYAPPLQYNIVPTNAVVPANSYNQGSDPWQAAQEMASAVGYELFFDVNGVVTGYPTPDPATLPVVWNFTDDPTNIYGLPGRGSAALLGSAYSTPTDVMVTFTRDHIYNDVFITGQGATNAAGAQTGSTQPVLGEAADRNPSSPTYINGPMGRVPEFVSSNIVITNAQAQTQAQNDLNLSISAAWQVSLNVPPSPLWDIDDVVTVTRPRVGLNKVPVVIDTVTHTVSYADMTTITGRVVTY